MLFCAPLHSETVPALQWIEVATSFQIPHFQIIGLPSPEVAEAKDRIRSAIETAGFAFPRKKIILNLAPASVRKRGTGIDLAMALAILDCDAKNPRGTRRAVAWGELGLQGNIKPLGLLTRAIFSAWNEGIEFAVFSEDEKPLALRRFREIRDAKIFRNPPPLFIFARTLGEAWRKLNEAIQGTAKPYPDENFDRVFPAFEPSSNEIVDPAKLLPLSPSLERTLAVSAAGSHHVLLLGSRGSGKSHALEWLAALQPPTSNHVNLEQTLLAELQDTKIPRTQIRRIGPHARPAALLGSSSDSGIHPGELTLAHGGLLVADEFLEWPRDTREALREPLERGVLTLTRARGTVELPARFVLAASGNLCPCGGWPPSIPIPPQERNQTAPPRCRCTSSSRKSYLLRLSGPILDRIDLVSLVAPSSTRSSSKKSIAEFRSEVMDVRHRSIKRWGNAPGLLTSFDLEQIQRENPAWEKFWKTPPESLRAKHKVLRVALTLSEWDRKPAPALSHFLEASCYRPERFGLCA